MKKIIEITQKDLDKIKGEERQKGYDLGLIHGKSEKYPYRSQTAYRAVSLIDALVSFLDERYKEKDS